MAGTSSSSALSITTLSSPQLFITRSNRLQHLHRRSTLFTSSRPTRLSLSLVMCAERRVTHTSSSDNEPPTNLVDESVKEDKEKLKAYGRAKIHDFCFGIPYGVVVLSGGLLGFIFSRNPTTLGTGVLFGGALLALSTFSLKIWRQGKSSLPFVLGQAVLSAALFWKNFQAYSLTKMLIPAGFYTVISAGMLCFYVYVMISGGNPPPKKLQTSATVGS